MADKPTAGQFPSITFGGTNQSTYTSSRSILNHTSLTSSSPPRIMSNSENRLPPLESLLRNEPLNKPAEKPFNVSTMIISPPSIPMDNFHQNPVVAMVGIPKDSGHTQSSKPLLSPPISPAVDVVDLNAAQSTPTSATETDPILFPSSGQLSAASPPSLFGNDAANDRQRAIEQHVAKRDDTLFKIVAPPKQQEYDLMLTFQVNIMRHFQKNPQQWLQRCKQQLKADAQAREKYRNRSRFQPIQPAKPNMIRVSRPVKPEATVAKPSALRPIRSKNSVQKPARQSGSPEPKRAPSSREDKDFNAVPDFCPPQSSLDQRSWDLDKIDWKGTPVDLSTDPHAHLLHPEELQLASRLRLDCATYLTNKRRLFVKRLWAARKPKDFRKTDAQQACKIDVNKASRLWTAYDMAGWLQVKYMEPYMDVELPEE